MKKTFYWATSLLFTVIGCQSESLHIQRSFPFQLEMDAFPTSISMQKPTSIGFGIKPDYLTTGNTYTFSWQVAAPAKGILLLNSKVLAPGSKMAVLANMSQLLSDTLTYMPKDSGSHELTFRVFDEMGQAKDTTFTLTAVR